MPELSRFYGIIIKMYFNDTQQHHKPDITFVSIVMGAATKELLYQEMNSLLQNINS